MITVALVEDDVVTRRSLCERIAADGHCSVVAAVGTCRDIRTQLQAQTPDVLLVDLGLPDGDGIDVIAEAAARYPQLDMMVITVFGDEKRVVSAIRAGASGYLLKDDPAVEIVTAIQQLHAGGSPISPAIARHLIRLCKADAPRTAAAHSDCLTPRELEVLALAAKGFSYAEIAQVLELSAHTIASHAKRIYEKLAVTSRAQAIYEAARAGLLHET